MIEPTHETQGLKCPYCGFFYTYDARMNDYLEDKLDCDSCNKTFLATIVISHMFIGEPMEGDDDK